MDEEKSLQEGNYEHLKANLVWVLTKQYNTTLQGEEKKIHTIITPGKF